jgi:hypothetical protein
MFDVTLGRLICSASHFKQRHKIHINTASATISYHMAAAMLTNLQTTQRKKRWSKLTPGSKKVGVAAKKVGCAATAKS